MKLLRFRYLEIEKFSNQSFYLTRKKSIEIKKGNGIGIGIGVGLAMKFSKNFQACIYYIPKRLV